MLYWGALSRGHLVIKDQRIAFRVKIKGPFLKPEIAPCPNLRGNTLIVWCRNVGAGKGTPLLAAHGAGGARILAASLSAGHGLQLHPARQRGPQHKRRRFHSQRDRAVDPHHPGAGAPRAAINGCAVHHLMHVFPLHSVMSCMSLRCILAQAGPPVPAACYCKLVDVLSGSFQCESSQSLRWWPALVALL